MPAREDRRRPGLAVLVAAAVMVLKIRRVVVVAAIALAGGAAAGRVAEAAGGCHSSPASPPYGNSPVATAWVARADLITTLPLQICSSPHITKERREGLQERTQAR